MHDRQMTFAAAVVFVCIVSVSAIVIHLFIKQVS